MLLRTFLFSAIAALFACTSVWSQEEWANISDAIYDLIPDYEEEQAKLYRKVGGIVAPPTTGHIYVIMNRNYGVFKSTDHGETWKKLENAPVQGRIYGGFGISLDAETGRFAIFAAETNKFKIDPIGGMTLDAGETWTPLPRPEQAGRHDGFTWGAVDWTSENPQTVLGKQHHAWITMWLSQDAGKSWIKLDFESRNVGVINENILLAGVDSFVTERNEDVEPGIYRSTDAGETWSLVSPQVVNGKAPTVWGENAYWTFDGGVLVSRDQGATWDLLGQPVPGALYGPYFGLNEQSLMVVTADAFFITHDGGQNWEKVADNPAGGGVAHPTVSYGWDPNNDYLYYAPVGGDVYRLKLGES